MFTSVPACVHGHTHLGKIKILVTTINLKKKKKLEGNIVRYANRYAAS